MRLLEAWYPMQDLIAEVRPQLRAGQLRQLSLWVAGAVLADSGCESAVVLAVEEAAEAAGAPVAANTMRHDLRELFRAGPSKRPAQGAALALTPCFPRLLAPILQWLDSDRLALAVDAPHYQDRYIALAISVV